MFKSILVPIDLASDADDGRAIEAAAILARPSGATLHLVTVVPDFGMAVVGSYFEAGYEKKVLADTREKLDGYSGRAMPSDVKVATHVAHGSIYREIIRVANELGCDAIVMAAHRPELSDYLLGPNAARVVRHADQSVFVIRS